MKITNVKLRKLVGYMPELPLQMVERLRIPMDIYPRAKKNRQFGATPPLEPGKGYKVSPTFVQIDTDEGVSGIAGPIGWGSSGPPFYIDNYIKPLLLNQDPIAIEYLWDAMYRSNPMARRGDYLVAMSMVDIALWDLKGKWVGKPVVQLLGGSTQEKIPAYISTLGWSLEPAEAIAATKQLVAEGYAGMKWFLTEGPPDGNPGISQTIELIEKMREAAGPDFKIMVDAWKSWDVRYTLKMAGLLEPYDIYWIEEPVMPDNFTGYAEIKAASPIPIATGEAHATRWEFELMMDLDCCDIYEPEPINSGGISEVVKICNMASARDRLVSLHCGSLPANLAISFSQSPAVIPIMEYLPWGQLFDAQFFFRNKIKPVDGYFYPPTIPGLYDIDESKIASESNVTWREIKI